VRAALRNGVSPEEIAEVLLPRRSTRAAGRQRGVRDRRRRVLEEE
jgi:alkylhydroperoxidase/carboxymuconolactone decarboxylase family protein YurZ